VQPICGPAPSPWTRPCFSVGSHSLKSGPSSLIELPPISSSSPTPSPGRRSAPQPTRQIRALGDAVLWRVVADVGRAGGEPGPGGAPRHGHGLQRTGALRLQPQRRLPALPRVAPPAPHPRPHPGPQAHVRAPLLPPIIHRQDRPDHVSSASIDTASSPFARPISVKGSNFVVEISSLGNDE
jgi:hypothetical protein